jgi:hypothetical protein
VYSVHPVPTDVTLREAGSEQGSDTGVGQRMLRQTAQRSWQSHRQPDNYLEGSRRTGHRENTGLLRQCEGAFQETLVILQGPQLVMSVEDNAPDIRIGYDGHLSSRPASRFALCLPIASNPALLFFRTNLERTAAHMHAT